MMPLPMAAKSQSDTQADAVLLGNIHVAKPCPAEWQSMVGDDKSRFCPSCRKNVYNLSAMTAAEAATMIREKEGKMCVRYYQRADGTLLTQDCPVGVQAFHRRVRRAFAASIVGFAAFALAAADFLRLSHGQRPLVVERLQVWAERFAPQQRTMGAIAVQPIPMETPAPVATPEPDMIMGDMAAPPQHIQGMMRAVPVESTSEGYTMGKPRYITPAK